MPAQVDKRAFKALRKHSEPFRLFKTNDEVMEFVNENIDKNNIGKETTKELYDAVEEVTNGIILDMKVSVKRKMATFLQRIPGIQCNSSQELRKAKNPNVTKEAVYTVPAVTKEYFRNSTTQNGLHFSTTLRKCSLFLKF